jgi:hypothetical protein
MKLRAGDWVRVKSARQILATLDEHARLDDMPFMPQMFQYSDRTFRVYRRAHKTCDTVNRSGGRRLRDTVHLELRCDGEAYGGCQAGCLIFWKTAWLEPLALRDDRRVTKDPDGQSKPGARGQCTHAIVLSATAAETRGAEPPRFICQATELPRFTSPLSPWDLRQYVEDYTSGNVTLKRLLGGFLWACANAAIRIPVVSYRFARTYDWVQSLWGGLRYPRWAGQIPAGQATPSCSANLQPGEWVRVRAHQEILSTLDTNGKNRGLYFDAELVPYCGQTRQVRTRLERFIDERTGRMIRVKTPAIILDGVWCQSRYSDCRLFCPRSIFSWWREIWLERTLAADRPESECASAAVGEIPDRQPTDRGGS